VQRIAIALVVASGCSGPASVDPAAESPAPVAPRTPVVIATGADIVAFVDVTVIGMDTPDAAPHQTVIVRAATIAAIGAVDRVDVPPGATRVDGRGKFLIPGLHDMHVHVDGTRGMLTSFVEAGVTTVRNMAGNPRVLALGERIGSGELLGPRIVTAGPFVDGAHPRWEGSEVVTTAAGAEAVVAAQAAAGYAFVKVYNGLSLAAYDAIVAAAGAHGLRVVGHVPAAVPLDHALAVQASIEHLSGYAHAIERADSPVRHDHSDPAAITRWLYADPDRVADVAAATARAGVWNCPTLVTAVSYGELWSGHVPSADLDAVSPDWRARWDPAHSPRRPARSLRRAVARSHDRTLAAQLGLVRELVAAGAPLLAGTDTPNPYVVPGTSLHQELGLFVEAGLSPYAALRTATADAGDFLGDPRDGRIVVGAHADLVMLAADPLADLHALDQIDGVMVHGGWLGPERLRDLHDELVDEYRQPAWEQPIDLGPLRTVQYTIADNTAVVGAYAFTRERHISVERQTLEDETVDVRAVVGDHRLRTLALDVDRPEGHTQIDHAAGDRRLIGWLTPATVGALVDGLVLDVDERTAHGVVQPDPDAPATLRAGELAITRLPDPSETQRAYRLRLTVDHGTWVARLVVDGDGVPHELRVSSTTRPVTRTWKRR
jgi:imidazolonepropionase-like amidohydrolase